MSITDPLYWDRMQVAVKEEAVEGTAETLAAAQVILAHDVSWDPEVTFTPRPAGSASLSPFAAVAGAIKGKLSFKVALAGSGAAGTPPSYATLLLACAAAETIAAGVSVTYAPASTHGICVTLGWYVDGKRWVMAGCRGTFKLDAKAGEAVYLEFELQGTAIVESDSALLAGVSYGDEEPPPFMAASSVLDTYEMVLETFGFDQGNKVSMRPDAGAAQGYISALISGREPKITLNPDEILVASKDWWSVLTDGIAMTMAISWGVTPGNIITLNANTQMTKKAPADRDGQAVNNMELSCVRSTGDDEYSIVLT